MGSDASAILSRSADVLWCWWILREEAPRRRVCCCGSRCNKQPLLTTPLWSIPSNILASCDLVVAARERRCAPAAARAPLRRDPSGMNCCKFLALWVGFFSTNPQPACRLHRATLSYLYRALKKTGCIRLSLTRHWESPGEIPERCEPVSRALLLPPPGEVRAGLQAALAAAGRAEAAAPRAIPYYKPLYAECKN